MSRDTGAKGGQPEQIGRYRVIERIGHGAMGLVYRARDEAMGREVAIKLLVTDLEDEPEVRARFLREAEAAARLSQPNIITIFDVGEDRGRFFIVMELLRGATLKEYLEQREHPSLDRKIDLMIQLCAGLAAAHNEGIYHRDIKPGNLFVRTDGILKILDFGVARLSSSNMTSAGLVVGTPDYMSPEQARGLPIDGRSDIFSAGGVFYFMLTGRKPFEAGDLPSIFRKIQFEQPRAMTEAEAPPELAAVIMKALTKDKTQRYQTCQELVAELNEIKQQRAVSARTMTSAFRDAVTVVSTSSRPIPPPVATPTAETVASGVSASDMEAPAPGSTDESSDAELTTWAPSADDNELTSYPAWPEPAESAASQTGTARITGPKLVVFRGDAVLREFALTGGSIKIGRDHQNELVLDDEVEGVADVHAEVRPERGGYTIVDRDSAKGLWFRKQRVQSVGLRLGEPVTIGAFEIALEDDSGSLDASAETAAPVVAYVPPAASEPVAPRPAPAAPPPARPVAAQLPRPAPRPAPPKAAASPASRRTLIVWGAAAALILAVAGISFWRFRSPTPTPPPQAAPTQVETPAPAPVPASTVEKDLAAQQIAQDLAAAKERIGQLDFAGALKDHLRPLLERDPQNAEALALKAQAEDGMEKARLAAVTTAKPARPKDAAPDVKPLPGITRNAGESAKDYTDRAARVQSRYARGRQELAQKRFAAAIESFMAVEKDQPNYLEARSLMAEASNQRSAAYREAMDRGVAADTAGQLMAAWRAFREAEQFDTTQAAAEKTKSVRERMSKAAADVFSAADAREKLKRIPDAIRLYEQIVNSLPEDDELRTRALERLKVLKP